MGGNVSNVRLVINYITVNFILVTSYKIVSFSYSFILLLDDDTRYPPVSS